MKAIGLDIYWDYNFDEMTRTHRKLGTKKIKIMDDTVYGYWDNEWHLLAAHVQQKYQEWKAKSEGDMTPSEEYNMPVIGKIKTKAVPMTFKDLETGEEGTRTLEPAEYEVISDEGDFYICNQWYKPGVPQLVHKDMVETFMPIDQREEAALAVIDGTETDAELEALAEQVLGMTPDQKEKLEAIYQDSITTLEPYWTAARDDGDVTTIVDQILSHYQDEIAALGLPEQEVIDYLTEQAFGGIT